MGDRRGLTVTNNCSEIELNGDWIDWSCLEESPLVDSRIKDFLKKNRNNRMKLRLKVMV